MAVLPKVGPSTKTLLPAISVSYTHLDVYKRQVRVSLVPDVPHHAVVWGVEDIVQRDREFHGAQIGAQMAACPGHAVQQLSAQFGGQGFDLRPRQAAQIIRGVDRLQQGVGVIHQHMLYSL